MALKRISLCKGKGSVAHNNREYAAKNVKASRTVDNITYVSQPIGDAYAELFSEALKDFNIRARSDRQIKNTYFEHLFNHSPKSQVAKSVIEGRNKQKSFYEELVQIGDKDDSGVGSADGQAVAKVLDEYMRGWQERNPRFHVFNAVLHLDEATPHLHIDYIPVADSNRGLTRQNGMAKALEQMGFDSKSAQGFKDWRQRERDVLTELCVARGIEIAPPEESRGVSLTPDEYKAQKDAEKEAIEAAIAEAKAEADAAIADAQARKAETLAKLETELEAELQPIKARIASETLINKVANKDNLREQKQHKLWGDSGVFVPGVTPDGMAAIAAGARDARKAREEANKAKEQAKAALAREVAAKKDIERREAAVNEQARAAKAIRDDFNAAVDREAAQRTQKLQRENSELHKILREHNFYKALEPGKYSEMKLTKDLALHGIKIRPPEQTNSSQQQNERDRQSRSRSSDESDR